MSTPTFPSGQQFEITFGEQSATLVEVGGGIREYTVGSRPVLDPYPVEAMRDGAHGAPLIPWPNRLADGRYTFDGQEYQVDLTEPDKRNAIHGFMLWRTWQTVDREPESLTMSAMLYPQPGYPFTLELRVRYELGPGGLEVTMSAKNLGECAAPYAVGQHPYLSPGAGRIDDAQLSMPGRTRVLTDEQRQLPRGTEAVAGTEYDFTEPRALGGLEIDFAFTDLDRDETGRAVTSLRGADGACAQLWVDESFDFVELFTGDTLASDRRRRGLGVEPMSAGPNALGTGEGVFRLLPGATHIARWGARLA